MVALIIGGCFAGESGDDDVSGSSSSAGAVLVGTALRVVTALDDDGSPITVSLNVLLSHTAVTVQCSSDDATAITVGSVRVPASELRRLLVDDGRPADVVAVLDSAADVHSLPVGDRDAFVDAVCAHVDVEIVGGALVVTLLS